MARCPFATWDPVPLSDNQKRRPIKPVGLVLHTAVSNSSHLRPTGEVRWHFYVNRDGKLYQYFDTGVYAPCHRDGNYWSKDGQGYGFLSVESWDGAGVVWDGKNTAKCPKWTPAQVATLAKLGAWLKATHGIELVKATGVHGKGIGYHSQYTAPDGQLRWNESHACPAARRIAQFPSALKAMQDAAKPQPEDELTPEQAKQLEFLYNNLSRIGSLREPEKGLPPEKRDVHALGYYAACADRNAFDSKELLQEKAVPLLEHIDYQEDARHKELWTILNEIKAAITRLEAK